MAKKGVHLLVFIIVCMGTGGCAVLEKEVGETAQLTYHESGLKAGKTSWPDVALQDEFTWYWKNRLSGNWDKTWAMEAPYFREIAPMEKYKSLVAVHSGNEIAGIEIWEIVAETNRLITVKGKVSFNNKSSELKQFFVNDSWILVRGNWYHVFHDPILFPSAQ